MSNKNIHLAAVLVAGWKYVPAYAYNDTHQEERLVFIIYEDKSLGYIDSTGAAWQFAYPVNPMGNRLTVKQFNKLNKQLIKE